MDTFTGSKVEGFTEMEEIKKGKKKVKGMNNKKEKREGPGFFGKMARNGH